MTFKKLIYLIFRKRYKNCVWAIYDMCNDCKHNPRNHANDESASYFFIPLFNDNIYCYRNYDGLKCFNYKRLKRSEE